MNIFTKRAQSARMIFDEASAPFCIPVAGQCLIKKKKEKRKKNTKKKEKKKKKRKKKKKKKKSIHNLNQMHNAVQEL